MTSDTPRILLAIEDNTAYSPESVANTMSIRDLMDALAEAAEEHGEDALIVLDNGQNYGARFGGIDIYRDLIALAEDEDEDAAVSL